MFYFILVCTSMSKYEWVHTSSYMVYTSEWCKYADFRGRQRDAVLLDMVLPSHGSDLVQKQREPDVPPKDEEFFAGVVKLYEPLHPVCTWLLSIIWLAESP